MVRCALTAVLLLTAVAAGADGVPVPRRVVALLDRPGPSRYNTEDPVHELAELPLNYLGMEVRRCYLADGPPDEALLEGARAVLTWFEGQEEPPAWLWPWLEKVAARGLRVIHVCEFGPLEYDAGRLGAWLRRFGLDYDRTYEAGPLGIEIDFEAGRACTFEADPSPYAVHRGPRSLDPANRVWISTRLTAEADGDRRTPVVTGPWGGIALDPFAARSGTLDQDRAWFLDPFAFLREALGLQGVPAPHPAVLNGRRMWFLHIDGDGFESLAAHRPGVLAADVMREDVLERYALPFTVSVIVGSLTPDLRIPEATPEMELARRILNLPNVEPASHGVRHAIDWQDAQAETDGYVSFTDLRNYEFSLEAEVRQSVRFLNERLLLAPRRCAVMLWTGHANAREAVVRAAAEEGCVNLNGGVFRWDPLYDSLGFVTPWGRRVGDALQVYAGAANENDFDGFFENMPHVFAQVDETIARTGSPRILKPADVYIHFYSAEHPARLETVHALIRRWGFEEPTAPVHASTYARAVTSALDGAEIRRTPGGWRFARFGDCRTVRIDDEPRHVDWDRSRGVLGARRSGATLFVHLAAPEAALVLRDEPEPRPHVREANCLLDLVQRDAGRIHVRARAFNRRLVVFAGFAPEAPLLLLVDGEPRLATSDADGCLEVTLERPGESDLLVTPAVGAE